MNILTPFLLFVFHMTDVAAFVPGPTGVVLRSSPLQMGILGRFRNKKEVKIPDQISVGTSLPEVDVQIEGAPMSIQEALGGGTSLLVGMPGAFTPTCSGVHLPGYVEAAPKLAKLGVKNIAVVTTNDQWVNNAWGKDFGIVDESNSPVTMISDGDGELVRQLGLADDMGFGVGIRSKRFAMIVKDGEATHVEVDDGMDECESTSAQNLIKVLTPESDGEGLQLDQQTLTIIGGAAALALAFVLFSSVGDGGSTASSSTSFQMLNELR